MRTYKENVIELSDGETVIIRAERGTHQKLVSIEVSCGGWYDYKGEPNGLEVISPMNELRSNGETLVASVEVIPPDLELEPITAPVLEQHGFTPINQQ